MIPSLEDVTNIELGLALCSVVPTIALCIWQKRPFGLWIFHSLLIQYLCLYWIPYPYARVGIGLLIVAVLAIATDRRSTDGF